ncbi:MAG TPA: valine--tRNA ligase [Candidatus Paceibacterota bacterium]|nr:valine--tRNA ligase [Candidatus Paceibacterota bacterium]
MEPKRDVPTEFLKPYNPAESEPEIIALWDKSGYTNPDTMVRDGLTKPDAEAFSIVLPPPNVTGTLHMGHAAMLAVEDILVRYARMNGKRTLWVPGTDSAAIATQSKVEGEIYKKEKKTRYDLGRDELMKRIDAFVEESKNTIINQVRAMGASLDWSRYAYTMDEPRYHAVMTAFVRMYEAGLIYRGDRIVNWDPNLQTTVSDDEIEWKEETRPFYYLKYGPFVIGTARPETKFGDKYVVMHPDDERYKGYAHGQKLELEWINGPITATVIKDEAVDMEFGTGVMTITPWHDATDFDIAERHKLEKEQVIDDKGILLPIAGEFAGMHIKKARPAIVEKLKHKGLIDHIDETYVGRIATNSRGNGIIEPQIKKQWFIAVNKKVKFPYPPRPTSGRVEAGGTERTLKEWMREAVESGRVKITPERFEKIYYHWIDNLRDWCISRQIWFGHRIPVWYRGDPSRHGEAGAVEVHCSVEGPNDNTWERDPDTLDTWFSSGLWTFSTLGWPEETADLKTYHPTSVLETGYDILFFWVARMVLMSGFLLGDVPFRRVYLHGLVRDGQGRKMSKSLGNIIDPLDMIKKYGADATRLSLIIGAQPGNDLKLSEDRVRGYKHFANKLWNISRFVLENTTDVEMGELNDADRALFKEAQDLAVQASKNIDHFRLDLAADSIYHFVWDRFAAEIIEESKPIMKSDDASAKASRARLLYELLTLSLKLLHPFMPFVTEAIWQRLPQKDAKLLMVARWPVNG